ncbi:MAG: SIS domain-containing protein [Candidatus Nealsonbacteria bacterium]
MLKRNIKKIYRKNKSPTEYFREYSKYLFHLLANLNYNTIEKITKVLLEKSKQGKTVFLIGNGGSAATASHFATDLSHGILVGNKPLVKAVSLVDNIPLMTAISNDKGYEKVFTNQLRSLFQKGDILIAISASGSSLNLVSAVKLAKKMGGVTIGLVGFDGGKLAKICDYVVNVSTEKGQYGPVEDVHIFLDHMISSYLGLSLKKNQKK